MESFPLSLSLSPYSFLPSFPNSLARKTTKTIASRGTRSVRGISHITHYQYIYNMQ